MSLKRIPCMQSRPRLIKYVYFAGCYKRPIPDGDDIKKISFIEVSYTKSAPPTTAPMTTFITGFLAIGMAKPD